MKLPVDQILEQDPNIGIVSLRKQLPTSMSNSFIYIIIIIVNE